jgi:hypothetical protein
MYLNKIIVPEKQNCKRLNNVDYNFNHVEHIKNSRNKHMYLRNNFKESDKFIALYNEGTRNSNIF